MVYTKPMKPKDRQASLKPQDVIVLLKLILLRGKPWRYEDLRDETGISVSECHSSIHRLLTSKLIREDEGQIKVNRLAVKDFLFHGLPYVFPAKIERMARGIPVAHSGPLLGKKIVHGSSDIYVWSDDEGKVKGESIVPLYRSVPEASKKDPKLYELLSLIEALRVGKAREVTLARKYLEERISA